MRRCFSRATKRELRFSAKIDAHTNGDRRAWVTGHSMVIDGGYTCQ